MRNAGITNPKKYKNTDSNPQVSNRNETRNTFPRKKKCRPLSRRTRVKGVMANPLTIKPNGGIISRERNKKEERRKARGPHQGDWDRNKIPIQNQSLLKIS
jgi:hypothetical protein